MLPRQLPLLTFVLGCSIVLWSQAAFAQQSQDELVRKRAEKLESEFLRKAAWITDYEEALKIAREQHKLIFGYYTRSYSP